MNLIIKPLDTFKKSAKNLSKKYKKISEDLKSLEATLRDNPEAGINIGKNCFKIRVANSSIPKGKSGGFRVIYYYRIDDVIYLMDIYSKSDLENISEERLTEILKDNSLLD